MKGFKNQDANALLKRRVYVENYMNVKDKLSIAMQTNVLEQREQ